MFCFYPSSHIYCELCLFPCFGLCLSPVSTSAGRAGLRHLNVIIQSPQELIKFLGLALARYLICFPVNPPLWPPDFPSLKGSEQTSGHGVQTWSQSVSGTVTARAFEALFD